jgi:uncharacterized protein YdeI (YjbR/CyaY-like superfamily)
MFSLCARAVIFSKMLDRPIIAFSTAAEFRNWLADHHVDHAGIWLKFAKKASGIPSVTYPEAVDEALCFGWIDGQVKRFDESWWLQRFTKRGPRSIWSKINVGHVTRLTAAGRMQPAGLAAVEAAQADGRWEAAYHSPSTAELPEDFRRAVDEVPAARAFCQTLAKSERYRIYFQITTAKQAETRARRIANLVSKLERGEKP